MAKTFTQKELVSNNLGGIDHEPGDTAEEDQQIHELIDRFKNLRIRPSLKRVYKVLEYSGLHAAV
ncbi:MAG: hypothetical protein IPI18_01035 [Saprospiraceae bacterium]|nr:hypothetical protein [Saprospiraceae bacterium]